MRLKTTNLLTDLAARLIEEAGDDIGGARAEYNCQLRDYFDGDSEDGPFATFLRDAAGIFKEAERLDANRQNANELAGEGS
jgi:hypothetical protein